MRRMQRNAISEDFSLRTLYHVEVWTYPERVFIYILLVTPNWSCRLPCYIGKWQLSSRATSWGPWSRTCNLLQPWFFTCGGNTVCTCHNLIWWSQWDRLQFSSKKKERKRRRKDETQNRTKSDVAFSSAFSWKVTITAHFLQPYQPNRNQWKVDLLLTYIYIFSNYKPPTLYLPFQL